MTILVNKIVRAIAKSPWDGLEDEQGKLESQFRKMRY